MNYQLIAIQVGDLLKYDTTINDINRAAASVFRFSKEDFPNESITSSRAKLIHDWILTLAKQKMDNDERNELLKKFLRLITPADKIADVKKILKEAGVNLHIDDALTEFYSRNFHHLIHRHCLNLYKQRNYFHAVFEAAKVYNKIVKEKAESEKDGYALMMDVWGIKGVLKVTRCETETDKNVQEGLKFLSAGLMQAIRNPTAHEPALDWPISKDDCLDLLSFISFLLRQLDKAVYYKE
ncbi:MAG: hypothetical protein SCAL_000035 [Candidatus Syntrophoarchaeum caldarius]|uniref:Conserved hypothetical protein CHP02391 domain-containing protein n=1 Tax=Candidatus Syntropharchaeum caldarium TaxID=1838285 RepID=A0A1F2PAD5_9EURY|nr:MAG: hypothetical protein SCAL_000035 [Candidatus Syntrophoarchaeum caldarius]